MCVCVCVCVCVSNQYVISYSDQYVISYSHFLFLSKLTFNKHPLTKKKCKLFLLNIEKSAHQSLMFFVQGRKDPNAFK